MVLKASSPMACNDPSLPMLISLPVLSCGPGFAGLALPTRASSGGVILALSRLRSASGILGIDLTAGSGRWRRSVAAAICSAALESLFAACSNFSMGAVASVGARHQRGQGRRQNRSVALGLHLGADLRWDQNPSHRLNLGYDDVGYDRRGRPDWRRRCGRGQTLLLQPARQNQMLGDSEMAVLDRQIHRRPAAGVGPRHIDPGLNDRVHLVQIVLAHRVEQHQLPCIGLRLRRCNARRAGDQPAGGEGNQKHAGPGNRARPTKRQCDTLLSAA